MFIKISLFNNFASVDLNLYYSKIQKMKIIRIFLGLISREFLKDIL